MKRTKAPPMGWKGRRSDQKSPNTRNRIAVRVAGRFWRRNRPLMSHKWRRGAAFGLPLPPSPARCGRLGTVRQLRRCDRHPQASQRTVVCVPVSISLSLSFFYIEAMRSNGWSTATIPVAVCLHCLHYAAFALQTSDTSVPMCVECLAQYPSSINARITVALSASLSPR